MTLLLSAVKSSVLRQRFVAKVAQDFAPLARHPIFHDGVVRLVAGEDGGVVARPAGEHVVPGVAGQGVVEV